MIAAGLPLFLAKRTQFYHYANGLPFVARRYCALWGRGT